MKIYSIIPARGGSKGVPKKNVRLLGGFPLIAYSIAASKLSKNIQRTIVSTDSEEIAEIAKKYGAEVPFMRPSEFAQDKSTDFDVLSHAVDWFEKNEGAVPDLLVYLRPTTPFRDLKLIDSAIDIFIADDQATSLRSAHELAEPPQKMFQIGEDGYFKGFFPNDPRSDYHDLPRQMFPKAYHPNGYVDIVRSGFIKEGKMVFGPRILSFITPIIVEIDRPEDFEYLEYDIKKSNNLYDYLKANFSKEA
ncbi:MAG: acylneuraminate cytidylyltransferase family protein [Candidatus Wolfebacteria bacterium]|nr:acylneuraminate cytidylyltransferase family protein [Candidatus Wolfebacteria bacterium]